QPADLDIGGDRLRTGMAGSRADIERIGAVCDKLFRLGERRFRIEEAPAVGKGVLGDVQDAEQEIMQSPALAYPSTPCPWGNGKLAPLFGPAGNFVSQGENDSPTLRGDILGQQQNCAPNVWKLLLMRLETHMRIAQVPPLVESVPPTLYGGTERVVSYLTEELVKLGHRVTLFASGDSVTRAKLEPMTPRALRLAGVPDCTPYNINMLDK